MSTISVRYDDHGVYEKNRKLVGALPQLSQQELDELMDKAKFEVSGGYSGGANYQVSEVYGQVYQRTGNLGRSVFWERHGLTYKMKVEAYHEGRNYGADVLGKADGSGQIWVFIGRWPNFAKTMSKWTDIAIRRMQEIAEKAVVDFGL